MHRPGHRADPPHPGQRRRAPVRRRHVGPAGPGGARRVRRAARGTRACVVHHFADLLAEALDQPGAREFLQDRLTTATRFGPALDKPLDDLVASTPGAPARRAAHRRRAEVATSLTRSASPACCWSTCATDDFLLRPLPNHLFQRDNSAWIYDGAVDQPDGQAGAEAGDDQLPGHLQLPPDVRATPAIRVPLRQRLRGARTGHHRGRRHHRHRQRRRDDRHGRAHHPPGDRDPGPVRCSQPARPTR